MSFRHTRNKSTQSSKVLIREAGMQKPPAKLSQSQIRTAQRGASTARAAKPPAPLTAAKIRFALLKKCRESFHRILRFEAVHLLAIFLVQRRFQRRLVACVD